MLLTTKTEITSVLVSSRSVVLSVQVKVGQKFSNIFMLKPKTTTNSLSIVDVFSTFIDRVLSSTRH